eukprot:127928_1
MTYWTEYIRSISTRNMALMRFWILLFVCISTLSVQSSTKLPETEINALLDIYNSMHGHFWTRTKWNTSHIKSGNICLLPQYNKSITCNTDHWTSKLYTETITFVNNNLSGSMPSSIGNLRHLKSFIIRNESSIVGSIPNAICQLQYLQTLEITATNMTGFIPDCIKYLKRLNHLILDTNHLLTGSVPFDSICDMKALQTFKLLRSPYLSPFYIPKSISNLKQLTRFELVNVSLFGGLNKLCNVVQLEEVIFDSIYTLHRWIPHCLGSLAQLKIFRITSCPLLYGSLPSSICGWEKIESLGIYGNNDAPYVVNNVNYTTEFKSILPSCIGDLKALRVLNLQSTGFHGWIPYNVCQCTNLSMIHLDGNAFNGTIPDCLGQNMSNLQVVHMEHNKLKGTIPSTLCAAHALSELWLNDNRLEGSMPKCIVNNESLPHLRVLSAGHNALSGSIDAFPSHIVNLSLYSNRLEGTFPAITNNVITALLLHDNLFSGTLDDIFFANNITLNNLQWLTLHSNAFYSPNIEHVLRKIFDESGDIIEMLTLYDNADIHGHLPEYTSSNPKYLHHLHHFNAHQCDISGSIPQHVIFNELEFFTVHSNRLSCAIPEHLVNRTTQTAYEQRINKTRQTIVVLGNHLQYYNDPNRADDVLPHWIVSPFKQYRATNLYVGEYDTIRSVFLTILCALCLLLLIAMLMTHTFYMIVNTRTRSRARTKWFEFRRIPNIGFKFINCKYLSCMIALGTLYKFSSNYFLCTMSIASFDLAWYSLFSTSTDEYCVDGLLCALWIIASTLVCHMVCDLCIQSHEKGSIDNVGNMNCSEHTFDVSHNPLFEQWHDTDDDLDNISLASSFLAEDDDDPYNTTMDRDYDTATLRSWKKYGYFILWNALFIVALSLILLFGVSQALPDNNILNIHNDAREILCDSIAIILALNSCVTIPNLVDSWNILIYNEYTPKTRRGKVVLILRSVCGIVIPMISSFILLNNCGRYWVKFWNPCIEKELAEELFTSKADTSIYGGNNDLLHADSVCKPLTSAGDFNLAKCLRQYFNKWIIILIEKLFVCLILPMPIIGVKWLKFKWRKWTNPQYTFIYPRVDSEYFMVLTKVEIMIIWSLIAPAIVPITLVAIQANRFFYGAVIKNCQWKLANRAPAPVKFLCFSIIIQQILIILFANVAFNHAPHIYSYVLIASFIVIDAVYVIHYLKATTNQFNKYNVTTVDHMRKSIIEFNKLKS